MVGRVVCGGVGGFFWGASPAWPQRAGCWRGILPFALLPRRLLRSSVTAPAGACRSASACKAFTWYPNGYFGRWQGCWGLAFKTGQARSPCLYSPGWTAYGWTLYLLKSSIDLTRFPSCTYPMP